MPNLDKTNTPDRPNILCKAPDESTYIFLKVDS